MRPMAEAAAAARHAEEEEKAAVAAAVARSQSAAAKQAGEHALLLQLERCADEAFRAHEYRVWQAAHPQTAAMLEKSNERIRGLQQQLAGTYEQIRAEQATQLQLKAQIEQRTGHLQTAAANRAETMLEQALKSARSQIVVAAAAYDGVADGVNGELADGEPRATSGTALLLDGAAN